jgi:hypothetical protein
MCGYNGLACSVEVHSSLYQKFYIQVRKVFSLNLPYIRDTLHKELLVVFTTRTLNLKIRRESKHNMNMLVGYI